MAYGLNRQQGREEAKGDILFLVAEMSETKIYYVAHCQVPEEVFDFVEKMRSIVKAQRGKIEDLEQSCERRLGLIEKVNGQLDQSMGQVKYATALVRECLRQRDALQVLVDKVKLELTSKIHPPIRRVANALDPIDDFEKKGDKRE